ncbi:hypothetical protein GE061_012233 [Apolygus lucorum]|uniref:U1-type domain-containing protein n=1 Tax=Apolygus lucorum TaxID=248454 RepID=A0A8S9XU03_APOLU|nr:hypothetical protein GE061_012233 [Apolygus lucorum]
MGKDRPPSYSRSSRERESSRGEYRSMTRSPSPMGKPGKRSRKKYSRSSSSSSSASDNDRRSHHKVEKRGSSSPIVLLQSSPERETSTARSKWLDSSPNFQPMTPPSPPNMGKSSSDTLPPAAPPPPPMESQPIPSFQREDNYRSVPPKHAFPHGFPERFSYGNDFFQGGNSSFRPPETNSQHGFDMNNIPPPTGLGPGPSMVGTGPVPSMMGNVPPPNMVNSGPPIMSGPNMDRTPTPNMATSWETQQGNFPYANTEFPPPHSGIQMPVMNFSRPPDPVPSPSNVDIPKANAVEQELVQQKRTLAIQREEYFKKKISLTRDLKSLKDKKRELQKDKGSEKLLKENMKLQDEIEQKLKSLDSVIEMLTHIIGDKDEIEMLLKDTSRRSASPPKKAKKKRSRSKSPSRSRSDKKRSPPPSKRSSSPHVNIVHYDPELHWCSVCNVFPRSASSYLSHLHSDQHKTSVKNRKDKDTPDEEFAPWRVHERREPSPPSYKNAPSRRVPIRGVPFLTPATAWYCSLCKMWLGDLEVADRHLRGEKHAANYSTYVTENPHWEVDWLRDRTRAYERNSEARSRVEDTKEDKYSKKEGLSKKQATEVLMQTSDVAKLEERLMAMISANNAALSKGGSSKEKNRGRSSSRSDGSYSESSSDERRERKKKKKNKKKKKTRDSREKSVDSDDPKRGKHREKSLDTNNQNRGKRRDKSAESDDHKKGKRREKSVDSDDQNRGGRREKSAESDNHKKWRRREKSIDSDDQKKGKPEDEGGMKRKWDDDKRKEGRGGIFNRADRGRNDRPMNTERNEFSNRGRGRGRGRGDGRQFDNRRLINRNPLWRPTAKDRVSWDNPKERLAVGRNVFGLDAKEYYGPEVPPKKDNKTN